MIHLKNVLRQQLEAYERPGVTGGLWCERGFTSSFNLYVKALMWKQNGYN